MVVIVLNVWASAEMRWRCFLLKDGVDSNMLIPSALNPFLQIILSQLFIVSLAFPNDLLQPPGHAMNTQH